MGTRKAVAWILIVEDEPFWRRLLQSLLESHGYHTMAAVHGSDALYKFDHDLFDLVLLDLFMDAPDGLAVCRHIRRLSNVPIVFLSAAANVDLRIAALQFGADDFLSKEQYLVELLPRIRAVLRRYYVRAKEAIYMYGPMRLNATKRTVFIHNRKAELTTQELDLLLCLMRHPGKPVDKKTLSRDVWQCHRASDGQIQSAIRRLREKLEDDPANPKAIQTVRGVGYQLFS